MKVINIISSLDKSAGGPSRSVPQTCKYVSCEDIDVDIITRKSKDPITINREDKLNVYNRNLLKAICADLFVNRQKVSLFHLQHIWHPFIHLYAMIARIKRIPYIISTRGMLEPWIMNRNKLKKKIAMRLYQRKDIERASCIHVTCKQEEKNIRALGFDNRIIIIPNGIDLSKVTKCKENYNHKKIVFLSRIHEKKGLEILLLAWKNLNIKSWSLEIAGDGNINYIKRIESLITINNIKGVVLVGPKYGEAKWDYLRSGDIFVLPSYSENFGIVVAEALAVGLPVITTTGTPWEELQTEKCGWWIQLGVKELENALLTAINSGQQELMQMGQRGRKLVESKYSIETVAKSMKVLYEHIAIEKD